MATTTTITTITTLTTIAPSTTILRNYGTTTTATTTTTTTTPPPPNTTTPTTTSSTTTTTCKQRSWLDECYFLSNLRMNRLTHEACSLYGNSHKAKRSSMYIHALPLREKRGGRLRPYTCGACVRVASLSGSAEGRHPEGRALTPAQVTNPRGSYASWAPSCLLSHFWIDWPRGHGSHGIPY